MPIRTSSVAGVENSLKEEDVFLRNRFIDAGIERVHNSSVGVRSTVAAVQHRSRGLVEKLSRAYMEKKVVALEHILRATTELFFNEHKDTVNHVHSTRYISVLCLMMWVRFSDSSADIPDWDELKRHVRAIVSLYACTHKFLMDCGNSARQFCVYMHPKMKRYCIIIDRYVVSRRTRGRIDDASISKHLLDLIVLSKMISTTFSHSVTLHLKNVAVYMRFVDYAHSTMTNVFTLFCIGKKQKCDRCKTWSTGLLPKSRISKVLGATTVLFRLTNLRNSDERVDVSWPLCCNVMATKNSRMFWTRGFELLWNLILCGLVFPGHKEGTRVGFYRDNRGDYMNISCGEEDRKFYLSDGLVFIGNPVLRADLIGALCGQDDGTKNTCIAYQRLLNPISISTAYTRGDGRRSTCIDHCGSFSERMCLFENDEVVSSYTGVNHVPSNVGDRYTAYDWVRTWINVHKRKSMCTCDQNNRRDVGSGDLELIFDDERTDDYFKEQVSDVWCNVLSAEEMSFFDEKNRVGDVDVAPDVQAVEALVYLNERQNKINKKEHQIYVRVDRESALALSSSDGYIVLFNETEHPVLHVVKGCIYAFKIEEGIENTQVLKYMYESFSVWLQVNHLRSTENRLLASEDSGVEMKKLSPVSRMISIEIVQDRPSGMRRSDQLVIGARYKEGKGQLKPWCVIEMHDDDYSGQVVTVDQRPEYIELRACARASNRKNGDGGTPSSSSSQNVPVCDRRDSTCAIQSGATGESDDQSNYSTGDYCSGTSSDEDYDDTSEPVDFLVKEVIEEYKIVLFFTPTSRVKKKMQGIYKVNKSVPINMDRQWFFAPMVMKKQDFENVAVLMDRLRKFDPASACLNQLRLGVGIVFGVALVVDTKCKYSLPEHLRPSVCIVSSSDDTRVRVPEMSEKIDRAEWSSRIMTVKDTRGRLGKNHMIRIDDCRPDILLKLPGKIVDENDVCIFELSLLK